MASTAEEFREVLEHESHVDMKKLTDIASHGVPDCVRGDVWNYLLGAWKSDKSEEMKRVRQQKQEYDELDKKNAEIQRQIARQLKRLAQRKDYKEAFAKVDMCKRIENIMCGLSNYANADVVHGAALLDLLAAGVAIASVQTSEMEAFYCFNALLRLLEQHWKREKLDKRIARFMSYFQSVLPEIYLHFEEEEMSINEWATSWLQFLLSRELPLHCLVRLWDTYFARADGLDLHPFVCLAILSNCGEELVELGADELKSHMQRLPSMDMDEIIAQAQNIRDDIKLQADF